MDYLQLGKSDLHVSRICLGTWNMSGAKGWGPEEDERSVELIRRAQDSGCNFFDTAHGYGRGHAEKVLGRALAEGERREHAVISTKIIQCDPGRVEQQLDTALERLQTDYVDLYIVHWPRPTRDLDAFLAAMNEMKDKGKTRWIGVSNFDADQMRKATEHGVVSLQPPYNILWRIIDSDVLPFCRGRGIAITPYSSLAQGLLTGRFSRGSEEKTGMRKRNVLFEEPVFSQAREAARAVDQIADEHGRTSPQIALAWLLHTEGVTAPIVGISKWSQWQDNLGALDVQLSQEEYDRLSRAGMEVWDMLPDDATMWSWQPD